MKNLADIMKQVSSMQSRMGDMQTKLESLIDHWPIRRWAGEVT